MHLTVRNRELRTVDEASEPDALDLQLIRLLQEDGRRPTAAIARDVGLPEATVRRRIDRLIREKTIRIVAVADDEKLGLALHVLIGVQTDLQDVETIGSALCALQEVRWVGMTTGPYDYVIEAFFHSTRHFHHFLTTVIAHIPGVKRTESLTVLSLLKDIYRWDLLMQAGKDRYGGGMTGETEHLSRGGGLNARV